MDSNNLGTDIPKLFERNLTLRSPPVTTEEYGLSKAVCPFNSRLDKSKLVENGFKPLPTWPDTIKRYLEILQKDGFFDELN